MTDLTISVPDDLMEKLRPHLGELPRVLELGVEQIAQPTPERILSDRERIIRLLAEKGVARPWDRNLISVRDPGRPRQKRLKISGQPLSELILEMRRPL